MEYGRGEVGGGDGRRGRRRNCSLDINKFNKRKKGKKRSKENFESAFSKSSISFWDSATLL